MTTLQCAGVIEKREGVVTMWQAYPLETQPNFVDWILPANGAYQGARYRLSIAISDHRRNVDKHWGKFESRLEVSGTVQETMLELTDPDGDPDSYQGHAGLLGLTGLLPDSDVEDGDEWWVSLHFEYDTGATVAESTDPQVELAKKQRESEYRTLDAYPEYPTVRLPEPEPDDRPDELTTAFPEIGVAIEYDGTLATEESTLKLPMGVKYGFAVDGTLVVLLDPDRTGAADPDVRIEDERNVIGIGPGCTLEWTLPEPVDSDRPYRDLWVKDGTVMAHANETWYEIDATTGHVNDIVDHYYGRFD